MDRADGGHTKQDLFFQTIIKMDMLFSSFFWDIDRRNSHIIVIYGVYV